MPVASKRCAECLLSSAKVVSDERRQEVLTQCSLTGEAFLCHKAQIAGEYIVCRGFFDQDLSLAVVLAKELNRVRYVDLPGSAASPSPGEHDLSTEPRGPSRTEDRRM